MGPLIEKSVGLLVESDAGIGSWMETEALSHALSRRFDLRSTRGVLWHILLFCWEQGHQSQRGDAEYAERTFSVQPPPIAGCFKSRCLGDTASLSMENVTLKHWASQLDFMVFIGSVPAGISPSVCPSSVNQGSSARRRRACAFLPAEVSIAAALHGQHEGDDAMTRNFVSNVQNVQSFSEIWARGPAEEKLLLQMLNSEPKNERRLVTLPSSVPDMVVRDAGDQLYDTPRQHVKGASSKELSFVTVVLTNASCETEAVSNVCQSLSLAQGTSPNVSVRLLLLVADDQRLRVLQVVRLCDTSLQLEVRSLVRLGDIRIALTDANVALFPAMCPAIPAGIIMRALHAGLPVIAARAWPANETIAHMHDGVLVSSLDEMTLLLRELISTTVPPNMRTTLLNRLTAPQPGLLLARQFAFALHVQYRLSCSNAPPPRVLSMWPGPHELHRRTELFRSDALRRHGFDVRELTYGTDLAPYAENADFVVAAKPQIGELRRIMAQTQLPVYVWTWDLIDYEGDKTRRAWFEEAARTATASFLNELGREEMWSQLGATVHYVGDGTVFLGDRGPGRRPGDHVTADSGDQVAFIGSVNATDAQDRFRVNVLKDLQHSGVLLGVYGPVAQWAEVGILSKGQVWADDAARVEDAASVGLSLSRVSSPADHKDPKDTVGAKDSVHSTVQGEYHVSLYHSDRLLRLTAAGACVVSNAMRGMDLLLPSDSIVAIRDVQDTEAVVSEVKYLLKHGDKRAQMRVKAEENTWHRHTWEDSVRTFLSFVAGGASSSEMRIADAARVSGASLVSPHQGLGPEIRENPRAYIREEAEQYYKRVGRRLLTEGNAAESLVYMVSAFEACLTKPELPQDAAVAALYTGDIKASIRLWVIASRLLGGWVPGSQRPRQADARGHDGASAYFVNKPDIARSVTQNYTLALTVLRRRVGGWIARRVQSVCDPKSFGASLSTVDEMCETQGSSGLGMRSANRGMHGREQEMHDANRHCCILREILMYSIETLGTLAWDTREES
jgi:hypothetical protein